MSRIDEAVDKLEMVLDHHLCLPRREELQEILFLLKEEQKSRQEQGSHTSQVKCGHR